MRLSLYHMIETFGTDIIGTKNSSPLVLKDNGKNEKQEKMIKLYYDEAKTNKPGSGVIANPEVGGTIKQENLVNDQERLSQENKKKFYDLKLDAPNNDLTKLGKSVYNRKLKKFRTSINIQKSNSLSYEGGSKATNRSSEVALLNNPRLPEFLAGISDVYEKKTPERRKGLNKVIDDIYKEKGIIRDESDVEENGRVPLFSEYLLKHDTQEDFDAFLADEEFRNGFLLEYIRNHTNKTTGEIFYSAIDATTQAGLAWRTHLYHKYKQEYPTGDNDKLDKIKNSANTLNNVKNHIDHIVVDSISSGSNLKEGLDKLFEKQKELAGHMTDSQKAVLEEYDIPRLLRESIKIYFSMSDNIDVKHPLQKTGDNVFDLKLRSYLYLYAQQYSKFENKGGALEDYEEELNKVLIVILVTDGKIDNAGYNEYLEEENALNSRMAQAQREARNRAIEWNRNTNSNMRLGSQINAQQETNKEGKVDYQEASGAEIAQEKNLSQNLDIKIKREPSETEKTFINKIAFRRACKDFILGNNDLKDFVSIGALQKFFIVGENGISFNQGVRDSFKLQWINKNGSNDLMKLNEIEAMLKGVFPFRFNKIKEGTIDLASNGMEKVDKIVKNHAIGAVIDNVRDVLDGLFKKHDSGQNFESFKYDKDNPVEIIKENDNEHPKLAISGTFGGNSMIVYYDTETGELFINSNLNYDGGELTVGKNSPHKKIGTIASFDNILQNFYNTPTDEIGDSFFMTSPSNSIYNNFQNPVKKINQLPSRRLSVKEVKETNRLRLQKICGTQIDKIGNIIEYELERETLVNGVVSSLFRTFNIFSDDINKEGKDEKETTVKAKNNIYEFVKMIQNSDNQTLHKFQEEMPVFMKFFCLSWGKNNSQQEQVNNSDTIFKSSLNGMVKFGIGNEKKIDIGYLRENAKDFKNIMGTPDTKDRGVGDFGILKILIDNFSSTNNNLKCIDAESIKEFNDGLKKKLDSLNKYEKYKYEKESKDNDDLKKDEIALNKAYE